MIILLFSLNIRSYEHLGICSIDKDDKEMPYFNSQ